MATKGKPAPALHPVAQHLRQQDKQRLMALTDGVFAIIMTILVLSLTVPSLDEPSDGVELFYELLKHWSTYVSYVVSFVVLGVYWVAHHNLFHFVTRVDRNSLWLNVLFLMALSIFPYPVQMIGRYNLNPLAQALYGADLCLVSASLFLLWRYQVRMGYVLEVMDPHAVRRTFRTVGFPAFAYALGVGLDCAGLRHVSLAVYFVIPLFYVVPGLLERVISAAPRGV